MRQIVNICVSALLFLALSAFLNQAKAQFSGGGGSPSAPPEKALSVADLQKACDGGNAVACSDLGVRYVTGDGVAKDAKTSATLFQRGCDGGDAAGCFDLAENYRIGYGVTTNINNAAAFYLRACDGKVTRGCVELAVLHGKGAGVPKDLAKSGLYADRGCKGGSAFGCAILGAIYIEGAPGYPKDNAKAKKLLVTACFDKADFKASPDSTSQVACPELTKLTGKPACQTDIYLGGPTTVTCFEAPGVWKVTETSAAPSSQPDATAPPPDSTTISNAAVNAGNAAYARQDFATAATQYAAACDAGNASACGALGDMFVKGEGVKPSGARAAAPLAKACDAGIAASCGNLGVLYDNGNGVSANKARAFALFDGACLRSDMASCYNQGRLYESGQGTGANVAQAAALYQKACTAGIADGCVSIGSMYANGVYFGQSESKAEAFYKLACTSGGAQGCRAVEAIADNRRRSAEFEAQAKVNNEPQLASRNENAQSIAKLPPNVRADLSCIVYHETRDIPAQYKTVYGQDEDYKLLTKSASSTTHYRNSCSRTIDIMYVCKITHPNYSKQTWDEYLGIKLDPGEVSEYGGNFFTFKEKITTLPCKKIRP